jgi:hypothetical protein
MSRSYISFPLEACMAVAEQLYFICILIVTLGPSGLDLQHFLVTYSNDYNVTLKHVV